MSALTDFRNTLHGAIDRNGATIAILRNFAKNGSTFQDYSASPVNGVGVGAPGNSTGTGHDGANLWTYDGTNDGHDLGTALAALVNSALNDDVGLSVGWDMQHTNSADRDAVFDGVDGSVRNGVRIGINYNELYNYSAHMVSANLIDNAGNSRRYHWNVSTPRIATDGVTRRAWMLLTKTAGLLYFDASLVAITLTSGSALGAFAASPTHKYGFACTGFGASISLGAPFAGTAGNLCVVRGLLTEAQIRADLGIGNTNADGQPLCYVFRADTGVLAETGPDVAAGENDPVIIWREQNAQLEISTLGYTAGASRDTANEDPRLVLEHNGSVPTVAFDNNFSTTGFNAYLGAGGFRRNMMGVSSLTARRQVKATNLTMWFIGRVPSLIPLGGTVQGIIGLFSGGTLRAGLGISSTGGRNQVRWYENGGATSRVPLDADVPDCRNGPSLVYCEVSVGHDGACTVTMNRWSGSTTSAATVTNFACDEIRIGSWDVTTNGSNAVLWGCEFGISRCASTATERAARLARAFRAYSSGGWGLPGETANPRKEVRVFDDSLSVQYSKRCLGWPMLLPKACVRDTSWHMINIAGMDLVDASPDILDFAPDNAGRKDAGATKRLLIVKLCTNDALASDTGSQINADLGTVLAAVTDVDDITVCGLMDNVNATKRSDYQALINARVGSSITRAIAMPDIASRTVDGIHPDQESAMQDMANAIWFGNLPGGAGGGLAAALRGGAGAGRGGLGGAAFRARGDRRGLLIGAAG